jgi:4-diphosphocytidyl-2-C-methyl-D-erythritol kinase
MLIKSYAKINLSLTVIKKIRKKRLHDIQSQFCLINLFDTISVKTNKKNIDKIYFNGPHSKYVNKSNNSIQKILKIMRNFKLISNYYSIKIYKQIPVFAGLGGGSSNAASLLKFLSKRKIEDKIFNKIINLVGSDLRLFFYNQGVLQNLEKVIKFKKKYNLFFLVVYPNIKCSTKEVYSKVKNYNKKKVLKQNYKNKAALINQIFNLKNDLQSIVEKKYPVIQKLLLNISNEKGCYFSRMTGSGSACYGLFRDKLSSKVALKRLRKKYPKFWFSIAKTI